MFRNGFPWPRVAVRATPPGGSSKALSRWTLEPLLLAGWFLVGVFAVLFAVAYVALGVALLSLTAGLVLLVGFALLIRPKRRTTRT